MLTLHYHRHLMATTSLKLPDEVKKRAAVAARSQGVTTHAFMVHAIRLATIAAEQRSAFVEQAQGALAEMTRSGKGYPAQDVHAYARLRVAAKAAIKPKAKSWRT